MRHAMCCTSRSNNSRLDVCSMNDFFNPLLLSTVALVPPFCTHVVQTSDSARSAVVVGPAQTAPHAPDRVRASWREHELSISGNKLT